MMNKNWILYLLFFCLTTNLHGTELYREEGPIVKVLLAKEVPSVLLEVKGDYRVISTDTRTILSSGSTGKRYMIHAIKDGLRWGEGYPNVYEISILPKSPDTTVYINGFQYRGSIIVSHTQNNRVTVVNEVPIEDFLKSTLAIQYKTPLAKEAMAACVIAARTDCYAHIKQSEKQGWDFIASEVGYYGHAVTFQKNNVDEIVDATRLMIMESTKDGSVVMDSKMARAKAEALAERGCDAKKILAQTFPHTKIGHVRDHVL